LKLRRDAPILAFSRAKNALKSFAPQTPLWELTTLARPLVDWRWASPLPRPHFIAALRSPNVAHRWTRPLWRRRAAALQRNVLCRVLTGRRQTDRRTDGRTDRLGGAKTAAHRRAQDEN